MTNNLIYTLISVVFITQMTFYMHTTQTWKGILFFSCNWWWQKAYKVEKKRNYQLLSTSEGSHLLVQGEKVSYCKTYETHLRSTHIPLLFPLQWLVSLFHWTCYERTCWLQLQGRVQRYSMFTSEPRPRTRLYIQWTESIHTNPAAKQRGYWTQYYLA